MSDPDGEHAGVASPRRKGKWLIGCMMAIFAVVIAGGAVALLGARWAAEDYRAAARGNGAAAAENPAGDR